MLAFIPEAFKLPTAAIAGGIMVGAAMIVVNAVWWLPAAEQEGRDAERSAALQRSIEMIKQRSKTNEAVGRLSDGDLCVRLRGKWMQDEQRCE